MQPLGEELDECRRLRELGFYAKASKRLRSRLDISNDLRVAAELGEVLMFQGYWHRALQTLEQSLSSCTSHEDEELRIQVQMQICFLTPVITGSFDESLKRAETLYQNFPTWTNTANFQRSTVRIESYYSKVLQLAGNFRKTQPLSAMENTVKRLEICFNYLLERGRFAEAFIVASDFRRCLALETGSSGGSLDSREWNALLKILSESPTAPPVVKAKAMNELADYAEKSGDAITYCNLESLAKELFEQSSHAHGALDICLRQACRDIQEGAGDLDQKMKLIHGYVETYKKQDFPHGTHNALGTLLNSVSHLYNFELQLALVHMCQELAEEGGAKLFWILRYTGVLCQWLTHSGGAAKVIEGAKALYEDTKECDCQWLKGFVAQITAQAYWQISDHRNALNWASLCRSAWQCCSAMDRAEAATMELRAKLHLRPADENIEKIIDSAETEIEEEIKYGLIKPAIDQMDWIVSQIFIPKRDRRALTWLERIEILVSKLSGIDADVKLANMYQALATTFLAEAKDREDTKKEEAAIQILEKAIPLYLKHQRLVEAATSRQIHGMILYCVYNKSPTPHSLQRIIDVFSIANDAFRAIDISNLISSSSYWCSFFAYIGWRNGWVEAGSVLDALLAAESAKDQERIELSIFGGLEALSRKQNMGASKQIRDLYEMALHVCLQEKMPEALWEWVQKAKARSLSDLLGLGVLVPKALKKEIEDDGTMRDLFEKERALLTAIKEGEVKERLNRRGDLYSLQRQMRNYSPLKAAMDLREGRPAKLAHLHNLATVALSYGLRSRLVFVDWFFTHGGVYVCIVKEQEMPVARKCDITQRSIEIWKERYLDSEEGRQQSIESDDLEEDNPDHPLRQLDPLVEQLAHLVDKDDLVICSVTGVLHSIPIHALWINKEPFIVRNPMVYCASMTSFVQCWHRAADRKTEQAWRTIMAVYELTPDTDFHLTEQSNAYKAMQDLAATTHARVIIGSDGTRANLEEAIQSSMLFHFHGHCRLDKAIITDQTLVLADGDFSVRDVFKLKLCAPHITLIACDSASQTISAGDEPLGIVTALLCAGASSVLGTIWPIASSTGRNFSKHFYSELERTGRSTVLDLAAVLREAVIEIRGNIRTRQPYHWASFVLHGAWFMKTG